MSDNQSVKLTRPSVPAMDEILGQEFPVLDKGHIRVIDYMGGDEAIVQAARVSYGKGTKSVSDDRALIRYLMSHRHTTPFEMCELKLHIRCPMDVWRQWIRHRMASVNEYSTRYSVAIDDKKVTKPAEWRAQSKTNKQGSGEGALHYPPEGVFYNQNERPVQEFLTEREKELHELGEEIYKERLDSGVAREQARKDLPLSTYTEAYWKIDLHNLLHFLGLRMDSHAQLEIRLFANVIGNIVESWCPLTWSAFQVYRMNATYLSQYELHFVQFMNRQQYDLAAQELTFMSKRERTAFQAKLVKLGYPDNVVEKLMKETN